MGPNGYTATIGSSTSSEDFRGASTNDPDELRKISSLVRSDLWWAEDECKGLMKETPMSPLWQTIGLLLFFAGLISIIYASWVIPEIWWIFPHLFIIPLIIISIFIYAIFGAGGLKKDPYEEKYARVRELKAELEFIQDKIKRIEDA